MTDKEKIRNVAIVAHIDHGKTTLMDSLLQQTDTFRENEEVPTRVMDSFTLEKERGITIFSKHTSIFFEDHKLNIIDTPGHSDFSGEVERVLGMVQSVLLLVDANEGPMPQTRFVLMQALKRGLKPLVILNKIDRSNKDAVENTLNKTFDLFIELGATDEQLDFSYAYASAIEGYAVRDWKDPKVNMRPLFEMILEEVPEPPGDLEGPFLMQASALSYNDFTGRAAIGRILSGQISKGDSVTHINRDGHPSQHKITLIEGHRGLQKTEIFTGSVGDIISVSGISEIMIGDTLSDPEHVQALPPMDLGEPVVSVDILVNSSPFVGKDGKHVTMNKIRDRLLREKRSNVSLDIQEVSGREDVIRMAGRGELHLSITLETMRREGYEFSVAKPQVIFKEIDNETHEPFELTHIEVPEEFSGKVIEELSRRKGEMKMLHTNEHGITTIEFFIPTRGLFGYRNMFLTLTRGKGIFTSQFDQYAPHKGNIPERKQGSLISNAAGKATPYSLFQLQDRGTFFIGPNTEVYEGMIVGEHNRDNDLTINVTKGKQLTNVRASGTDENVILAPPTVLTLEKAIDLVQQDELIEITPNSIRLRKAVLNESERKKQARL